MPPGRYAPAYIPIPEEDPNLDPAQQQQGPPPQPAYIPESSASYQYQPVPPPNPSELYGGPAPAPTYPASSDPNIVTTYYPAANQGIAPTTPTGGVNPDYTYATTRSVSPSQDSRYIPSGNAGLNSDRTAAGWAPGPSNFQYGLDPDLMSNRTTVLAPAPQGGPPIIGGLGDAAGWLGDRLFPSASAADKTPPPSGFEYRQGKDQNIAPIDPVRYPSVTANKRVEGQNPTIAAIGDAAGQIAGLRNLGRLKDEGWSAIEADQANTRKFLGAEESTGTNVSTNVKGQSKPTVTTPSTAPAFQPGKTPSSSIAGAGFSPAIRAEYEKALAGGGITDAGTWTTDTLKLLQTNGWVDDQGNWKDVAADPAKSKRPILPDRVGKPARFSDFVDLYPKGTSASGSTSSTTTSDTSGASGPPQIVNPDTSSGSGSGGGSSWVDYGSSSGSGWKNYGSKSGSSSRGRSYSPDDSGGSSVSSRWQDYLSDDDGDGNYSPAEIKAAKKKMKMAQMRGKAGKGKRGTSSMPSITTSPIRKAVLEQLSAGFGRPVGGWPEGI